MTDTMYPSPDCQSDEHAKCDRTGWNETKAQFGQCPCQCHQEKK